LHPTSNSPANKLKPCRSTPYPLISYCDTPPNSSCTIPTCHVRKRLRLDRKRGRRIQAFLWHPLAENGVQSTKARRVQDHKCAESSAAYDLYDSGDLWCVSGAGGMVYLAQVGGFRGLLEQIHSSDINLEPEYQRGEFGSLPNVVET
jgi:hypothetical protein